MSNPFDFSDYNSGYNSGQGYYQQLNPISDQGREGETTLDNLGLLGGTQTPRFTPTNSAQTAPSNGQPSTQGQMSQLVPANAPYVLGSYYQTSNVLGYSYTSDLGLQYQQGFAPPTQQRFLTRNQPGVAPPSQQNVAPSNQQSLVNPTQQAYVAGYSDQGSTTMSTGRLANPMAYQDVFQDVDSDWWQHTPGNTSFSIDDSQGGSVLPYNPGNAYIPLEPTSSTTRPQSGHQHSAHRQSLGIYHPRPQRHLKYSGKDSNNENIESLAPATDTKLSNLDDPDVHQNVGLTKLSSTRKKSTRNKSTLSPPKKSTPKSTLERKASSTVRKTRSALRQGEKTTEGNDDDGSGDDGPGSDGKRKMFKAWHIPGFPPQNETDSQKLIELAARNPTEFIRKYPNDLRDDCAWIIANKPEYNGFSKILKAVRTIHPIPLFATDSFRNTFVKVLGRAGQLFGPVSGYNWHLIDPDDGVWMDPRTWKRDGRPKPNKKVNDAIHQQKVKEQQAKNKAKSEQEAKSKGKNKRQAKSKGKREQQAMEEDYSTRSRKRPKLETSSTSQGVHQYAGSRAVPPAADPSGYSPPSLTSPNPYAQSYGTTSASAYPDPEGLQVQGGTRAVDCGKSTFRDSDLVPVNSLDDGMNSIEGLLTMREYPVPPEWLRGRTAKQPPRQNERPLELALSSAPQNPPNSGFSSAANERTVHEEPTYNGGPAFEAVATLSNPIPTQPTFYQSYLYPEGLWNSRGLPTRIPGTIDEHHQLQTASSSLTQAQELQQQPLSETKAEEDQKVFEAWLSEWVDLDQE